MRNSRLNRLTALAVLLPALLAGAAARAAPSAGEVTKMTGRASAATPEGDIRALAQSSPVNSGETVVTSANSFVRMRLSDGAFVVLRPNTRFLIEDYRYAENDSESRSIFSLLKGGFRAVTGAIGRRNRANVSYRTSVATIGIRGTDVEVIDCTDGCPDIDVNADGVYFKVHEGGVDVNGQPFEQNTGGYVPPGGGAPESIDFGDPNNPLNKDPTPSANPEDC